MKILKQIISTFLLLALFVGMVPTNVLATDATATAQTGQTTIEGINSFGDLLSEEINEQQETEEENYSGGYTVTGLTISDSVATVTYSSLEEATLVVALYTEDGLQLLVSGNTTVQPEETEVVVELQGEIPEYFTASAYLLDNYDHSPLCTAYDTPMYTREMQELLASSTDDYEEDRVLNLDDDKSTNFAVYTDSTVVIKEQEGVNTVVSANDETATYVFENADHNIADLQAGQVFAYSYGENEILIVKVASININGTTATILGDDLELEEAFSHIKIESTGATKDFIVDDSTIDEGVSYNGIVKEDVVQLYSLRLDGEIETEHNFFEFSLDKKLGDNVKVKGTLGLNIQSSLSYYVSTTRQFIEFKTDGGIKADISVSGKATVAVPLGKFYVMPVFGVAIGFEPEWQATFSGNVTFSIRYGTELGFSYESGKGSNSWCTTKEPETDLNIKGTVFVGIDLKPTVAIIDGKMLKTELSCPIGLELSFVPTGKNVTGEDAVSDIIHTCYDCLDITFKFKAKLSVEVEFFKFLKYESDPLKLEFAICEMYRSFDYDEWLLGECPHKEYRVTFKVLDNKGVGISDVLIDSADPYIGGITNSHGVVIDYMPSGSYTVTATINKKTIEKTFDVTSQACLVLLSENSNIDDSGIPGVFGDIDVETITDRRVVASGECGADGADVNWTLYSGGLLKISGSGAMMDNSTLWKDYSNQIVAVVINHGVTTIGMYAFENCHNLTSVTIPDSVTTIGQSAFYSCGSLTSVIIPDSVAFIGINAFYNCYSLTSVTIPDSVTTIGQSAFYSCSSLTNVTIPDGVTFIGYFAFSECDSLTSMTIPDSVTTIGGSAFSECDSLTRIQVSVNNQYYSSDSYGVLFNKDKTALIQAPGAISGNYAIPDSVTTIGDLAFSHCDSLTNVTIPDSVTNIGDLAFWDCESLTEIQVSANNQYYSSDSSGVLFNKDKTALIQAPGAISGNYAIPDSVTTIGDHAFQGCYSLTSVTIPNSVATIGDSAFHSCYSLTSVTIPDSVITIGEGAFGNNISLASIIIGNGVVSIGNAAFESCHNLTSVTIPNGVTTIGDYAFNECNNLISVTIPDSVTTIGGGAFDWLGRLTDVYYGGTVAQWSAISIRADNRWLTRVTIHYNSAGKEVLTYNREVSDIAAEQDPYIQTAGAENEDENVPALFSIHDGEYSTEITDTYTLKTASFTGLVPGGQYVLLALISIVTEDILDPDNLLYIDQDVAEEDGTLSFTYVQRVPADTSYVVACGASNKNLSEATITFPVMVADEELQAVNPSVVFDGKSLTEGKDYVIVGAVDYTAAGEYTCYIRGIHNYTGLVQCKYIVKSVEEIGVDEQKTGKTGLDSSPDTFKFKPTENGVYRVSVVSHNNSLFNLRDSAGNTLVSKSGSQIVINHSMTAGAFYLLETLFTDPSISGEFTISVEKLVPATAMEIVGDNTITGYVGDSCNLATRFSPVNAIVETVNWSSNNTDIAEVDQTGWVKLLAPGTAIITATSENGFTDSISISIKKYPELIENIQTDAIINNAGASCYFTFSPEESGRYAFYSISDTDTYGYILDANLNTLVYDDDSGTGSNFMAKYQLEAGQTYVLQARYYNSSKTGSFSVCIEKARTVVGLEVVSMPIKTSYVQGFVLKSLDYSGLKLKALWSDGTITNWTYNGSWYIEDERLTQDTSNTEESGAVVLSCGDASVTLNLTVTENPVDHLEVVTVSSYKYIENYNGYFRSNDIYYYYTTYPSDAVIKVVYKNGSSATANVGDSLNGYRIDWTHDQYDEPWVVGTDNPSTVTYLGHAVNLPITVQANNVSSIEVVSGKVTCIEDLYGYEMSNGFYYEYEVPTDISIRINYNDGLSKVVNIYDRIDGYSISWTSDQYGTPWTLGDDNYLTISYLGITTKLPVSIVPNPVDYIEIVTAPTREYVYGDTEWGQMYSDGSYWFSPTDLSGLKFTVHYTDGTSKTFSDKDINGNYLIDGHEYDVSFNGDNPTIGEFPVTFTYIGKSVAYYVTLKESPVEAIAITKLPSITEYASNYVPDFVGMEFAITFTNGSSKTVTITNENLVYEYDMNLGELIHYVIVDGYALSIESSYSEEGKCFVAYYLGQCTEINGFTFTENQEISVISLGNVRPTGDNMNVTITYQDGSSENLQLDVVVCGDYYGVLKGFAKTDKGLIFYSISTKKDTDGNIMGYEVYILGETLEVEATADISGDVNNDGVVDTLDRMTLSRYLANWDGYGASSINVSGADVNGDGVVDTLDRMALNRHLANWDGYEALPYLG